MCPDDCLSAALQANLKNSAEFYIPDGAVEKVKPTKLTEPRIDIRSPGTLSTRFLLTQYLHGSWDRTSERDTAGGPLRLVDENKGVKNNPKWCQNPQYLLKIPAM